jgi:hypothetical protein
LLDANQSREIPQPSPAYSLTAAASEFHEEKSARRTQFCSTMSE